MTLIRSNTKIATALAVIAANATAAVASNWTSAPALNLPREDFAAAVDGRGNIWVLWGWDRTEGCVSPGLLGHMVDTIEVLNFDGAQYADHWIATIPPFAPRRHFSMVSANGFLYIIGGIPDVSGDVHPIADVLRYDTLNGEWSTTAVPPNLTARIDAGTSVDPLGRIWVVGGAGEGGSIVNSLATTEYFDPARPQYGWRPGPTMNSARTNPTCVTDKKGNLAAVGGFGNGNIVVGTVETLDPCSPVAWSVLAQGIPGPANGNDKAVVGADGGVYATGGWASNSLTGRVERLKNSKDAWDAQPALGLPRANHQAVLGRDDFIYIIAGDSNGCLSVSSVERRDTRPLKGDMNDDGYPNNFDIDPFVSCVIYGVCP